MQKNVDDFCPLFSQNLPESFELLKRKFWKISQNDGNEIVYGTTVCTVLRLVEIIVVNQRQ